MEEEIALLKEIFAFPIPDEICYHRNVDGSIAPCCQSSQAVMNSVVHAIASTGELYSLMQYLEEKFHWGTIRDNFHCNIVQNATDVDCASRTAMALQMFGLFFLILAAKRDAKQALIPSSKLSSPVSIRLACVHVLLRCDKLDSTRWRQQIKVELKERHDSDISRQSRILNSSFYGSHAQLLSAELKSRCAWIGSACCYHKCVGFINSFGHLTIWDFGEVYTFNSSTLGYAGAVQSLCVTPCVPISASSQQFVIWGDNMVVPFNKWVDILAAEVDAGQYNLDGGLGQNPSNNPSGGNSLLEREQRTIVADVFRTPAHPIRNENNLIISDLMNHKREFRGERLILNYSPEVVVYISGCHMSSNPGPGVGVGRALRAEFTSSQLHLVGVDSIVGDNFQALTDHVFDEVRAIELVTSCAKKLGYTTSKGIDNECWELLRDWLAPGLEPKCDKEHGPSRFYLLPCSDQDILSLARKVYSVLESKNCSQRDSIVCSRILCPPLSVVLDCRKPQIVCLRNMNCFKIPDFFTLTQDVCLMEVQTFCEVEYPVLFKGHDNGAKLCYSWDEVTAALAHIHLPVQHIPVRMHDSTHAYDHSHRAQKEILDCDVSEASFLQRVIKGTDKTILFSALRGVLTGCCIMTKVLSTPQGKVWAGDISHVPEFLLNDLVVFVKRTNWTGGGEIEFIETIGDQISNQGSVDEMSYYVIDFNPRFPAWILGSIYTGCNLPADLIRQVIAEEHQWEIKTNTQAKCDQVDQLCSGDNGTSEELFDKLYADNGGFSEDCFDSDGYKGDASSLSDSDEAVNCCTLTQSKHHLSSDYSSERKIATKSNKPADECCDGLICDSPRSLSLPNDNTTKSADYPSSIYINPAFSVTSIKQNHIKYSAIKGSFTRSIVELPRMNYVLDQQLDSPMTLSRGGVGGVGKGNMKGNFMDCAAKTLRRLKNHEQMWVPVNLQRKRKLFCDNNQDDMLSPIIEGYHDDFRHEEGLSDMMAVSDLISPVTAILECSEDFDSYRVKYDDNRLKENEIMRKVERIQEQCQSVCDVASSLIATNFILPRNNDTEFINTSSEQKSNSTLSTLLRNSVLLATPRYLLSGRVLEDNLRDSKTVVSEICNTVNQNHAKVDIRIRPQLCLSVKSQPHAMLLEAARCEQYVAECISLAEVAASLSAGFQPINIILTGPGKFWLGGDEVRVKSVVESLQSAINVTDEASYGNRKLMLGGIYADSLSDLRIILHRLNDSADWLGSHLVGIRFTPSVTVSSRFGIDAMDTLVVEQAASMIHEMPSHFSLGLHFHYAMSNQSGGLNPWLGMLAGFISLADHFESLCGKSLQVLDFGGGWTPQLIQQPTVRCGLIRLFADMLRNFTVGKESGTMETSRELCVQFELGKSISEQSGGLLCRVLGIREIRTPTAMFAEDDSSYQCGCDDVDSIVPIRRALIVDACIGDLSSPHLHPAFWMPSATDTTPNAGIKHDEWSSLSPGWNEIWGRTCMEFDVLLGYSPLSRMKGGISLPTYLKEGDFILFCSTGSYDMTMQYDFGDGVQR